MCQGFCLDRPLIQYRRYRQYRYGGLVSYCWFHSHVVSDIDTRLLHWIKGGMIFFLLVSHLVPTIIVRILSPIQKKKTSFRGGGCYQQAGAQEIKNKKRQETPPWASVIDPAGTAKLTWSPSQAPKVTGIDNSACYCFYTKKSHFEKKKKNLFFINKSI